MVEVFQFLIEVGIDFLHILWPFEKVFRRDGEKLRGVFRSIRPQQRRLVAADIPLQLQVILVKDPCPGDKSGRPLKNFGTIAFSGRAIQLVREFVEYDVMAVVNVRCVPADVVPGQYH